MKKKDLNELKDLYLNKSFNKLTIIDIYYDIDKKAWHAVCKCECGSQCNKSLNKVISGYTKTCGGRVHKLEQGIEHSKWLHDHYDIVLNVAANTKEWYKSNQDKVKQRSDSHRIWWDENRGKVDLSHPTAKIKRKNALYKDLLPILHPDLHRKLLDGDIKRSDIILTRCPKCGNYDEHEFHNIYRLSTDSLKYGHALLCRKCNMLHISHYEQEIKNCISEFYNGEIIQNDRSVLNGKELDLYYTEKKIAIEFNGDYWHSEKHKEKKYHYNKFSQCLEKGIVLVNIFENEWNLHKDSIKEYLVDLFNNKENKLSIIDDSTINNNYPFPFTSNFNYNYNEAFYTVLNKKVYTCGFSVRKL